MHFETFEKTFQLFLLPYFTIQKMKWAFQGDAMYSLLAANNLKKPVSGLI